MMAIKQNLHVQSSGLRQTMTHKRPETSQMAHIAAKGKLNTSREKYQARTSLRTRVLNSRDSSTNIVGIIFLQCLTVHCPFRGHCWHREDDVMDSNDNIPQQL
ncbi:hypothetical protein TNCV_4990281 [Trichonephila clavipes]|uniref:Uncharacterized protein n=1 Tax=Trichonephila clavipes TaxID=2585209 RepID=A0A8X6WBN8_TRICX|nr:hypothetical protein TNCV_4990281 [Trichonephila clavipes]